MTIGNHEFDTANNCYIMGILNVTPDSFSDGGMWRNLDSALRRAEVMIDEGADIIDIGGESTRPGHALVSAQEEIDRVIPVIDAICARFDIPVSIDTYKSKVAKAGLEAGAFLVNDIWGLKHDTEIADVIASKNAACCLMHNRLGIEYVDFIDEMVYDIKKSVDIAKNAGIPDDKIIIDPGVGFAKTYNMNLLAINRLDTLTLLGYPVLLGVSRKSVIGITLDLPVSERLEGTIAANIIGIIKGCSFLRVHDIKETKRAVKMARAIINMTESGL